jgi:hypothetical protein
MAINWLDRINQADKAEKQWRIRAGKIIKKYRSDDGVDLQGNRQSESFNILWSNVETLAPALYNRTPKPDIRRRYADKDPIAKAISEVLTRASEYTFETEHFDQVMQYAVHDALLVGRGVARIRYEPVFVEHQEPDGDVDDEAYESESGADESPADGDTEESDDESGFDELSSERVCFEHVQWDDFRCEPCRNWSDVTWVAFRLFLTRQELVSRFGEAGEYVPCDHTSRESSTGTPNSPNNSDRDEENRGKVWEIWDKTTRRVIFIAPEADGNDGKHGMTLLEQEDPLSLTGFFPVPQPFYTTEDPSSLIPVPDYEIYSILADDLDRTTKRIIHLTKSLKVAGIYDASLPELQNLYGDGDARLEPSQNTMALIERGGLANAIWFAPLEPQIAALRELYQHREIIKQSIYEVTGVSDIMRGQTAASETATAQQIKGQWGSLRLQRRQRDVQRFARDLLRLAVEVMAECFSPETLTAMTGLQFPTTEQKAMAQSVVSAGGQLPAELQEIMAKPSWEELLQVMRNDLILSYRIDIETDSTIAPDAAAEQQAMAELMTGVSNFVATIGPAVASGYLPVDVAKSLLLMAVRRFKAGPAIEGEIEKIQQPAPQQQQQAPDNSLQIEQMRLEGQMQVKQAELGSAKEIEAIKAAVKQQEIESSERLALLQAQLERERMINDRIQKEQAGYAPV